MPLRRLGPPQQFALGGISIPDDRGVIAHSDGDVLLHALMDAILGALGLEDIGHQFPDTDPAYQNADSRDLLQVGRRPDAPCRVFGGQRRCHRVARGAQGQAVSAFDGCGHCRRVRLRCKLAVSASRRPPRKNWALSGEVKGLPRRWLF